MRHLSSLGRADFRGMRTKTDTRGVTLSSAGLLKRKGAQRKQPSSVRLPSALGTAYPRSVGGDRVLIACQECSATISESASACPKCGAPPRVFLGGSVPCAECGGSFQTAWDSCRNCGAPRSVAVASSERVTAPQVDRDAPTTIETAESTSHQEAAAPDFLRTSGRSNRKAFIVVFLSVFLSVFLLFVVLSLSNSLPTDRLTRVGIVAAAMTLLLPVTIERLHDIGWSGWLAPVIFIPGGFLLFVLLAILPGTRGRNLYGPPPARS